MIHLRAPRYGGQAHLRPSRHGAQALLLWVALLAWSPAVFAQDAPELPARRVSVNAGVAWLGGYDVGGATAKLRGNGTGTAPAPFTLLTADSHFASVVAPEIRVGASVSRRIVIEGAVTLSRPRIGVAIAADPEAPAQELLGEELQQYLVGGGVTWQLPINLGRKLAPFLGGGAAYLRQLHEDRTFVETGQVYYAGGGARYWLRGGHGSTRPAGLRGEFRMNIRRQGIDFADKTRAYPTFSLSAFFGV
jgi:hypothetical protein